MNQIISYIFSIIILLFSIIIIININKTNNLEINKIKIQEEINILKEKINGYCIDPFNINTFQIKHNLNTEIYSKNFKICANNSNYIFCEKVNCETENRNIFKKENLDFKYNCNITKNQKIKIICTN